MHQTVKNLIKIKEDVKSKLDNNQKKINELKIIAVSKTFKIDHIKPLVDHGHLDFGENKVQEAIQKWSQIKIENKNIKLHLIGRLQTNKVKSALKIFDYIHSLDSKKLADKIFQQQEEQSLKAKLFIQVNIGKEEQKSGVSENELFDFYNYCKSLKLDILGLMCIPPFNEDSTKYFIRMRELSTKIGLNELSMGMSSDYLNAIENGSSFIRVGSNIFGQRG
ncbi:MAG: YggS family pyridoxal phosphate-dependent enzyme [Pseudomonadota bacterium]|nr:YggS family pyridoxal phosphate-dependent enzyme [Pseudomonadota bacterium]